MKISIKSIRFNLHGFVSKRMLNYRVCLAKIWGSYPGNSEGHVEILATLQPEAPRRRSREWNVVRSHCSKKPVYCLSNRISPNGWGKWIWRGAGHVPNSFWKKKGKKCQIKVTLTPLRTKTKQNKTCRPKGSKLQLKTRNSGPAKLQLMQNNWSNREELWARGRGVLPVQMSWTDSLRIAAPLPRAIALWHCGEGGGRGTYMACKGTPRMPGLPWFTELI